MELNEEEKTLIIIFSVLAAISLLFFTIFLCRFDIFCKCLNCAQLCLNLTLMIPTTLFIIVILLSTNTITTPNNLYMLINQ